MDADVICNLSRQLAKVSGQLEELALGTHAAPNLIAAYSEMILDEVKHVQTLALELTKQAMNGCRSDESAFAEGNLNSALGEENDDE